MNKLSIVAVATLASIAFVSAEETGVKRPVQLKAPAVKQMIKQEGRDIQMPNIKTGDPDTDSQLKNLNDEMETKIKSIRDEYVLKIKAIVGSRVSATASTTPRMMRGENGEKRGFDEGRKMGVPFMASSTASSTFPVDRMRIQDETEGKTSKQIIDGQNRDDQNAPAPIAPRIMNFFRGMFGGNR